MNFSQTISILFIGAAIAAATQPASSKIAKSVTSLTRRTTAGITLAQSLAPEQINLRAKQITVRIDGANLGSGVIINESNNVYTVLTNWHVIQYPGQYTVQTIDGRQHQVNPESIKQIGGLDLAIVKFDSNQNYQVAEIGNSRGLVEGQNIYFSGYPGELRTEDSRYYRFFAANLVGILPNSTENGYSLIYNGEAFPGMSGGPVLDRNGNLVGIHGEANINAITGGTSNYAIPIDTYQRAIAQSQPAPTDSNLAPNAEVPEVIVESQPAPSPPNQTNNNSSTPSETAANPNNNDAMDNTAAAVSPSETASEVNPTREQTGISSIPTFSDEEPQEVREVGDERPDSSSSVDTVERDNEDATSDNYLTEGEVAISDWQSPQSNLVSTKTGIDYKPLRQLLEAKQWEEADRQTYQLIDRIVKSAKQQNQNIFIELKSIAEFSCSDIRTIDALWQKYSGKQFGFTPQQKVWQNVNQEGDFSTKTWRRFATRVGWKQGEVASAGGYLLYDQLNFDPDRAPEGHLPWWFALPEEQQNVIKHLFARCNLDPAAAAAEAREAEANSSDLENNVENSNSSQDRSQEE